MTKENTKSIADDGPYSGSFYGLAEDNANHGIFSSILKRKKRQQDKLSEDVKKRCGRVESYKSCCDRLHQALMYMLVENAVTSKQLVTGARTEPHYRYAGQYLKTYEIIANQGRDKTKYESLEPAIKALLTLDSEHEKKVRKQLENLKPLTKFIGEDYWEYVRLKKVYAESVDGYDEAVVLQNKGKTEDAETAATNAQTWMNDCRTKLMDFITVSISQQKAKHADCVLKFRDESVSYHKIMADSITTPEPAEGKSVVKTLKQ